MLQCARKSILQASEKVEAIKIISAMQLSRSRRFFSPFLWQSLQRVFAMVFFYVSGARF
jgi:hypothetical protein